MARKFKELSDPIMTDPVRRERVLAARQAMIDSMSIAARRTGDTIIEMNGEAGSHQQLVDENDGVYLSTLSYIAGELGGRLEVSFVFPDETVRVFPRE